MFIEPSKVPNIGLALAVAGIHLHRAQPDVVLLVGVNAVHIPYWLSFPSVKDSQYGQQALI